MRLIRFFMAFCVILSFAACEKSDPFTETDAGNNTLGFLLDGKKVEYKWVKYAALSPEYLPSVMSQKWGEDSLRVWAFLDGAEGCKYIEMRMPLHKLKNGARLNNEAKVELTYEAGSYEEDGKTIQDLRVLEASSSSIYIRTCLKNKVLSGTFSFEGDAIYMNGDTRHHRIANGMFDVEWR